jgi:hypothetical protein
MAPAAADASMTALVVAPVAAFLLSPSAPVVRFEGWQQHGGTVGVHHVAVGQLGQRRGPSGAG